MADIDRRRRFIFRGNAAALGGRIVHPEDVVLESHVASSLTVAGGLSRGEGKNLRFGEYVSVERAETLAEGLFDSLDRHHALTRREVTADALSTTTRVRAEVHGARVGMNKPKLVVGRLLAALHSRSPTASGEPSIPVADGKFDGIEIDGYPLIVTPEVSVFQRHDTRSKLLTAIDDPKYKDEVSHHLLLKSPTHGVALPPNGRLLQSNATIYATIVKSIAWPKGKHPDAEMRDHHIVYVRGFGKLVFGELLITDLSRRLTMLRLELGSPERGDVAMAEVESNGVWG